MTSQVATQKRLLTTYVHKLEHVVSRQREDKLEILSDSVSSEVTRENISRLDEGVSASTLPSPKVERVLNDYGGLPDSFANEEDKELGDYEAYSTTAESALSNASTSRISFICVSHGIPGRLTIPASIQSPQPKKLELPPLPIPTFWGNVWEWDNLWEISNSNIPFRDISEMVKYNYLLSALRGEARECIQKFQVAPEAGSLFTSQSSSTRGLSEQVQVLISQLQAKGEETNSSWLGKEMLSEFPKFRLKREGYFNYSDYYCRCPFTIEFLSSIWYGKSCPLERCLCSCPTRHRLRVALITTSQRFDRKGAQQEPACAFLQKIRNTADAVSVSPANSAVHDLCFIRAQHHGMQGSLALSVMGPTTPHAILGYSTRIKTPRLLGTSEVSEERELTRRLERTLCLLRESTPLSSNIEDSDENFFTRNAYLALTHRSDHTLPKRAYTFLYPDTRTLQKGHVLLDTGSEMSFIDHSLARRLNLPVRQEKEILIRTFGSKQPQAKK
ncbi:hypothetical protein COOONC_25567 [Cooperia oncophora]